MSTSGGIEAPLPPYDHHTQLTDYLQDDHTQYALLAGRTGGQTLDGDTAASGNLTVSSTASPTKGKILAGAFTVDEANGRIGLNTTAPGFYFECDPLALADVATATGTAQPQLIRARGGLFPGGNTTITTTGTGGAGSSLFFAGGVGGTANSALTASTGGAGGSVQFQGNNGGASTAAATTVTGGAGGGSSLLAGNGGAVSGSGVTQTGGLGAPFQATAGNGGAESNGTGTCKGGVGGVVQCIGGDGGASTTGTGAGTHTGGNGGNVLFQAGVGGTGTTANGLPGIINLKASRGTAAADSVLQLNGQSGTHLATWFDGLNMVFGTVTGTKFGTAAGQKIGFYNAAPVAQATGTVAVAATASTNVTPFGYTTAAQADAIVTLVNALRTVLVNLGLTT